MEEFGQDNPQFEQFQPPPAPPMPLTQSDVMRLQQLHTGLSDVQQRLDAGELAPEEAEPARRQMLGQLQPLLERQQATEAAQKQQQQQELLHQNAMQQSMIQADAVNDSNHFRQRTNLYTDPLTGQTAHFYQPEPGKWAQMDLGEPAVPEEAAVEPQAYVPPTPPEEATGDTHVMTIQNGSKVERVTYKRDPNSESGWTSAGPTETYDRATGQWGVPQPAQQSGDTGHTATQLAAFRQRAEAAIGPPRLFGPPIQQAHLLAQHQQAVNKMASDLASQDARAKLAGTNAQRQADEHRKQEEARSTRDEQRAKLQQDRDLTAKQKLDIYHKELDRLQKDRAEHAKNGTLDNAPDYLKDDEAMQQKAHERAESSHKRYYPHRQDAGEQNNSPAAPAGQPEAPAAAPAPQAPAPPKPAEVDKAKGILAAIAAEEKRRLEAKAPPPVDRYSNPNPRFRMRP